jgi:histidine ammonia-lyase
MFALGKDNLTINTCNAIINGELSIGILPETEAAIKKSADIVQQIVNEKIVTYGVNTGFGILADTLVSTEETQTLQHKLLESHSVGVGDAVPHEVAKLMLLLKIHSLCKAHSGISLPTLERLLFLFNNNLIPFVPEKGSVGASGDLAPLSHLCLPLIGLGKLWYNNEWQATVKVLAHFKLEPIQLKAKEGLALINGTQFMAAYAVVNLLKLHNLLQVANTVGAMSLESLTGTKAPFNEALHKLRPFTGSQIVAQKLNQLLEKSEIMDSHVDCGRVQDPYSLRCMPQVHGATYNTYLHVKELIEIELNSVTDNPIIFDKNDVISGGNFHGQPIALPMDYACFATAELGNISDRRTYLLLEGKWGLPRLLMRNTGVNSGFMIPQYTTAALVTENKTLCFPASADSIPTSLGQEDHVSMGSISGRKWHKVLDNVEYILAIELLCACQAIEFRRPLKSSFHLEKIHEYVRQNISFAQEDRVFATDIELAKQIVQHKEFLALIP